jgi:hypothetical protein
MCHLNNQFVFCEVLPKRYFVVEVISCKEPFVTHFWESVDSMSSLSPCCEETRQQDKWKETMTKLFDNSSESIVVCHVPQIDYCFLWSSE